MLSMKKSWCLSVIVLFLKISFVFPLSGQEIPNLYNLFVIIQNSYAPIGTLGFHVFCSDAHGNRLTEDLFPILDLDFVSKYNNVFCQSSICFPRAITSGFVFPIQFPFIYRDVFVVLEDADKNDGWIIPKQRISVFEFDKHSMLLDMDEVLTSEKCGVLALTIQPIKESSVVKEFLGERQNDSVALGLIQNSTRLDKRLVERGGWQFEKSWFRIKGKDGGHIQTMYRIKNVNNDVWISTILGEQYKNERSFTIMHPDIRDVNFDGVPDLHVSNGNDDRDVYFGLNASTGKFEELFISRLLNLKIDYVLEQVSGDFLEYEEGEAEPLAQINYVLKGEHWSSVQFKRQELRKPRTLLKPSVESEVIFSEVVNGIGYELKAPVYGSIEDNRFLRLFLRNVHTDSVIFQDSIHWLIKDMHCPGNALFLVVKDYNHDGELDVYFPKWAPDQSELFYLSEVADGRLGFRKLEGLSYPEVMMMQGDFSFFPNKMKLQEYDDFNLDGWLDYRMYTQMDKSNGFWSYFIFHSANNAFQYSSDFSMLDHCSVSRNSNHICAWQELETIDGHKRLVRYHLNNGQLVVSK